MEPRLLERVWFGDDALARAARGALAPLGWLYGAVADARGALYDRGVLPAHPLALPAIGIGNLTVGGTGKTPVAAELARRLLAAGVRPAIVLRGYGDDEPLVHARLTPEAIVVADPDRVAGAAEARRRGADVCVLDDGFQHRRAARVADVVLVSADRWRGGPRHRLPAGPWREPMRALRRASLALVTRKAATDAQVAACVAACAAAAPDVPVAVARLAPGELRRPDGDGRAPLDRLRGRRVLAVAAIGDPGAFVRQLTAAGATVEARIFPDHHAFTGDDAAALARDGARADLVVCTLKDAVKLAPLWPRAAPGMWYVSQSVAFEQGASALQPLLRRVLEARPTPT